MPYIKIPTKVLVHSKTGMPYYSTRLKRIFTQGPASTQPLRFQDLAIKSLEDVDYAAILEKLKSDFGDKLFTETLESFRSGQQEGKLLVNTRTNTLVALVVISGEKKVVHSPMLVNDRDIKTIQSFVRTKFGGEDESALQKFDAYIEKAKSNLIPKEVDIHREGKLFQGIRWVKPEKGMTTPSGVRVPPNWQKVQLAPSVKSGLQAIGIDSKGRRQYLYSAAFRNKQNIKKFSRLKAFSSKFPQIQARIIKDVSKLEEAEVLYLVMKTGFRIGSDKETLAAKKAYGASTLLRDHVEIEGDTLHFHFPAKKGTTVDKTITDPVLAKILGDKKKGDEKQLFSVADNDVRAYLGHIGGAKFLIKDFRTHMGTDIAIRAMRNVPKPITEKELKKAKKAVAEKVAAQLCNTPAVALSSYIAPEIWANWEAGLAIIQKADQNEEFQNVPDLVERVSYDEELPELDPDEQENDDEEPEKYWDYEENGYLEKIEFEKHLEGQHDQSKHGNEKASESPVIKLKDAQTGHSFSAQVFHGSDKHFSEPKISNSESGEGIFLTDDWTAAESYGSNLYAADISLNNPLVVDAQGEQWFAFSSEKYIKEAKEKGHDGLVVKNIVDRKGSNIGESTNVISFKSSNVKFVSKFNRDTLEEIPLEKSRVAYHEHDGFQEHPVRVGDHQRYFAGDNQPEKNEIVEIGTFNVTGGLNESRVNKVFAEIPEHIRVLFPKVPLRIEIRGNARLKSAGEYQAINNRIVIDPAVFLMGRNRVTISYPQATGDNFGDIVLLHEFAHVIFGMKIQNDLFREEWANASREYGEWKKQGKLITKYSAEGAHEFFAECSVYYLRAPKILKQVHPTIFTFFDKYFSKQQIEKQAVGEKDFTPGLGAWWFETEEGFDKLLEENKDVEKEQTDNISSEKAKEIGDELKIDWGKIDLEQFRQGIEVELEHQDVTSGNLITTGQIALAHLKEIPDYYDRLKIVEQNIEKAKVAFHIHDGMQEHPVAVKDHQLFFSGGEQQNSLEEIFSHASPEFDETISVLSKYGKPYVVGGSLRDALLGKSPKDYDIEVYGIPAEKLGQILSDELGAKGEQVGKQFGVFKVGNLDISLPRRETKTGEKHTDFNVEADPTLSSRDAAKRRDFTINAMLFDPAKNELIDFFGGQEDLKNKVIKHVDAKTFVEDPLRVYRAAQFAARLGFSIDPETIKLASGMDLSSLPSERVYEEFKKMMLMSDKPSIGLQALDDMHVLEKYYPELDALKNNPQSTTWHAEGNTYNHSLMALDKAAVIIRRFPSEKDKTIVMLTTLLHDIGKPATTEDLGNGRITQHGHSEAGIEPAKKFLAKLTNEKDVVDDVLLLIEQHLLPLEWYAQRENIADSSFKRAINRYGIRKLELLAAVSEADSTGRLHKTESGEIIQPTNKEVTWFRERIKEIIDAEGQTSSGTIPPLISGDDLLDIGFKTGKTIGEILRDVKGQQEEGALTDKGAALEYVKEHYDVNLQKADTGFEQYLDSSQPQNLEIETHEVVMWGGWHVREQDETGDTLRIKIDAQYSEKARPLVIFHEIREDYYMRTPGLPYEQAHKKASEDEKAEFGEEAFNSEVGETRDVLAQNRGHKNVAKADEEEIEKLQPPRSGLIPQSGNWEKPYRWIRPKGQSIASEIEMAPASLSIDEMAGQRSEAVHRLKEWRGEVADDFEKKRRQMTDEEILRDGYRWKKWAHARNEAWDWAMWEEIQKFAIKNGYSYKDKLTEEDLLNDPLLPDVDNLLGDFSPGDNEATDWRNNQNYRETARFIAHKTGQQRQVWSARAIWGISKKVIEAFPGLKALSLASSWNEALDTDITVYRGILGHKEDAYKKPFVSYTLSPKVAEKFAHGYVYSYDSGPEAGMVVKRTVKLKDILQYIDPDGEVEVLLKPPHPGELSKAEVLLEKQDIALSVKAIILDEYGRLLLLRNNPEFSKFEFDLPGGHVDSSESEEEALTREILEETGLTVTNISNISGSSLDIGDDVRIGKDNHPVIFYRVEVKLDAVKTSKEHIGYSWVSPEDLDEIDLGAFAEILKAFFASKEDIKKSKVAYHEHDSFVEHPVAVKDHQKYFGSEAVNVPKISKLEMSIKKIHSLITQPSELFFRSSERLWLDVEKDEEATKIGRYSGRDEELKIREKFGKEAFNEFVETIAMLVPLEHLNTVKKITVYEDKDELVDRRNKKRIVGGVFRPRSRRIIMNQHSLLQATWIHEIAHAVQEDLFYSDKQSTDELFNLFGQSVDSNSGFPSEYSKTDVREFFAECYAIFLTEPEKLKERNISMYNFIEKLIKNASGLAIKKEETVIDNEDESEDIEDPPNIGILDPDLPDLEVDDKEEDLKLSYDGGIIALVPIEEVAKQLEIPGGIPWNEMHITLAYIKYPWYSDPAEIVKELDFPEFQGKIRGYEKFEGHDDKDAYVALIDVPELDTFKTQLTGKLIDAGFSLNDFYSFKPHITLAYIEKGQEYNSKVSEEFSKIPIIFKGVEVWNGDDKSGVVRLYEHDESVLQKLQPPRPGLVPKSGDMEHPFRWIRPEEQAAVSEKLDYHLEIQTKKINLQQVENDLQKLKIEADRIVKAKKMELKPDEISSLHEEVRVIEMSFLATDGVIWRDIRATYGKKLPVNQTLYSLNVGTQDFTEAVGRYGIYADRHLEIFYLGTNPKNLYWNPDQTRKRRGAGTALILEFVKLAKKIGSPRISLYSENSALPFYQKAGFHLRHNQNYENRMTLYAKDYERLLQ